MRKPLKIIFITIITILLLASLTSCCLYGYIKLFAPDKSISITVKGGELENVEDENLKYIFNIRSFNNLFEIRLNSFIDETKNEVYGTGIQFFNPTFETSTTQTQNFVYTKEYYAIPFYVYNTYLDNSYTIENFSPAQATIAEAVEKSKNLYKNAYFTITLDNNVYKFTFKDENIITNTKHGFIGLYYDTFQYHNNFMKLCYDLYEASKSFKEGVNQTYLFDFAQYLNFSKYDEKSKHYIDILDTKSEEYTLITKHMKAFFGVKIDCYKRDVQKASESLFNSVQGMYTYNVSNETISKDHFLGQNRICLTERDFEFKVDENIGYYIRLKDSVKNYYSKFNNLILDIDFNMTYLNTAGVPDFTIDKDRLNIENLKIYKIHKTNYDTSGNVLNSEVIYVD